MNCTRLSWTDKCVCRDNFIFIFKTILYKAYKVLPIRFTIHQHSCTRARYDLHSMNNSLYASKLFQISDFVSATSICWNKTYVWQHPLLMLPGHMWKYYYNCRTVRRQSSGAPFPLHKSKTGRFLGIRRSFEPTFLLVPHFYSKRNTTSKKFKNESQD